ncbi:PTS sugar transporter subunit IIA [Streptococcus didelphis]|uniref:PTS sugar transporter subunit IIA n=1 Tax=Streptococcus didelphis TaxID=102886 RepID=A0ABY9LFX3_9STRE|nr:PTS sugar transporter subunit IIA [Streptococcus didelphis]WMB27797.1 PTS sugar transporter subunit IIA [Streptococcus didelphis]WMB29739.1 PTS sugar transporter subunit IIA [Streptococcus didelphis]
MIKLIIVAHGNFPSGILSALELIAGKQEEVLAIDFVAGMSTEELKLLIQKDLSAANKVLILTDLLGGSPFNVSSALSMDYLDKSIRVLSGLNLAMLMEAVLSRSTVADLDQLADKALAAAHNGILDFESCLADTDCHNNDFEGGI